MSSIFKFLLFFTMVFPALFSAKDSFAYEGFSNPREYYDAYSMNSEKINKNCSDINVSESNDILEFIDFALCNNPDTSISWLEIKKQASSLKVAEADYLPNANFSSSTGESHGDTSYYSSNLKFSFDWLLYDFGKREASVNSEYYSLLKTSYQYNDKIQDIIYSVIESYAKLYAAREAVATALKAEESYKVAYDIAKQKYEIGLIAKVDVLQADTKYSQSVLDRQKAENDFLNYQGAFAKVLNLKQGTSFDLRKPEIVENMEELDSNIEKLIEKAMANRPDIKASEASEESYQNAYIASQKKGMPSISLSGSSGKTYYKDRDMNDSSSSSIGLSVSIPIFTGFENTYNEKKALYSYQSSKKETEQLKSEIAYEIWSAYNDLKTAQKNVEVASKLVDSSLESKNVNLGMYKVGLSDMLDVLEAESSYANAENEKIIAEYDKLIAEASLLKALGTLDKISR